MLKIYIICLVSFLILGCESTSQTAQKSKPVAIKNADQDLKKAQEMLARWDKNFKIGDILYANTLYRGLYLDRPDDINIQYGYYYSTIILESMGLNLFKDDFNTIYKNLHPAVKETVASPSRIQYLAASKKKQSLPDRISALNSFVATHPTDAFLWYELSLLQQENKNIWMAFSTAEKSVQLNSKSPQYAFQAADTATDILDQSGCRYDNKPLLKKSASYYLKAATLKPNEQLYQDNAGLVYARLGLLPIAYQRSKKAYGLSKNTWTAYTYARVAVLLEKYDEASEAGNYLVKNLKDPRGYEVLSMVAGAKSHWVKSASLYKSYIQQSQQDAQPVLVGMWLSSLANNRLADNKLANKKAQIFTPQNKLTPFMVHLVDFIADDKADNKKLINIASNSCELTEAYFYTAMKYWLKGDEKLSKHYLTKTKNQNIKMYIENIWANIFLKTL